VIPDLNLVIVCLMFFAIAVIYSSVGFGGGSSYLAVMALFSFPFLLMPKISLVCNIIVVSGGSLIFFKHGYLKIKKVWPFVIGSIPLSFLGGMIQIEKKFFLILLGFCLLTAGVNLWFFSKAKTYNGSLRTSKKIADKNIRFFFPLLIGSILGFISGLVGIGGGIFLSPVLFILNWGRAKEIAATSSFFILVNSVFGLLGQFSSITKIGNSELIFLILLGVMVFAGGQIGSRLGSIKLSELLIKKATAAIVLFVGIKILLRNGVLF